MVTRPAATSKADSAIRRALLWWFSWPANPQVCVNLSVDFAAARAYLASLEGEPRVSVNHLLTALISRALAEFPLANSRIVGGRIVMSDHVGVAMPINLLGHEAGQRMELTLGVVERAETLSLRQIAERSTGTVKQERSGRAANPFVGSMVKLIEHTPLPVLHRVLDGLDRAAHQPAAARRMFEQFPATTALTNPGATIGKLEGALFRATAVALPQRLVQLTTVWGVSAVQDEVIPVDGVPAVRPMLPVLCVFDHRVLDGVRASRLIMRFAELLGDPASVLGPQGHRVP